MVPGGRSTCLPAPAPSRVKVKLDENLPAELLDHLRAAGHEADTVGDEGLTGAPDAVVLDRVRHDRPPERCRKPGAHGATVAAVCYHGRTMGIVKRHGSRPGRTAKISISLDRRDLAVLRGRARRLFEGNLSAVIAEGVRRVKEEEGREALLGWLGHAARTSPAQREAVRAEWRGKAARRRGRVA